MPSTVQSPHALISISLDTNEHTTMPAWKGAIWAAHGFSLARGSALPPPAAEPCRVLWLPQKDAWSCYPASATAGTSLPAREERYGGGKWAPAGEMEGKKLPAVKPAARGSQLGEGWGEAGTGHEALQGRENQLDDTRLSPEALIHVLKCCDAIKILGKGLTLSPAFAASCWAC